MKPYGYGFLVPQYSQQRVIAEAQVLWDDFPGKRPKKRPGTYSQAVRFAVDKAGCTWDACHGGWINPDNMEYE